MMKHYENLIVGGGPSGLYMAWRLSSENKPAAIFEWSPVRLGGRIFTKRFDEGQLLELGGMRFSEDHRLVIEVIRQLNLTEHIFDFSMTEDRLYYLRGQHMHQSEIEDVGMPYRTANETDRFTNPDTLLERVANGVTGGKPPQTREEWFKFFDEAILPGSDHFQSDVFEEGHVIGKIGNWNLLQDQLGNEGFEYVKDSGGYNSNVINYHAAVAVRSNAEFGGSGSFKALRAGYSHLFETLERQCLNNSVEINKGQRLTEFCWDDDRKKFDCTFLRYNEDGQAVAGSETKVTCDNLLLCMPKRAIELINETEVKGKKWTAKWRRLLKNPTVQYYTESIIDQPAYKIGLVFDTPWWCKADHRPNLKKSPMDAKMNFGPAITDLPLRQVFYFGNNKPESDTRPLYGILAAYDDMQNSKFWQVLELEPVQSSELSNDIKPLFEGEPVPNIMMKMVLKQLNELHFDGPAMRVPKPIYGFYMNWGLDPFGAGYHAWKSHYKLAETQYYMTRPSETMKVQVPLYIAGSAYSMDQEWVEGAFCTAETILIDKFGLKPITDLEGYPLICRPENS